MISRKKIFCGSINQFHEKNLFRGIKSRNQFHEKFYFKHFFFSDWQVAHGRVSLLQIRVIINNVKIAIDELGYIEKCLNQVLGNVYDKNTVDEWLGTYLDPIMKQLCETRDRGNRYKK